MRLLFFTAWLISSTAYFFQAPCPAAPPNVLLIMSDDQGWGDIHSHGNDKIDTPVLDRLASEGIRFDRFFVSPVCAPTRASLLTGRDHLRTGTVWVTRNLETMRAEEVTLGEIFNANGYATGCFGKWHNGAHFPNHPNGQGFDEFFGFCAGHWNNYFDTTLERNGKPVKTAGYITDVLTDAAMDFISENQDCPFFCYIPYNAPHSPFQVPDHYFDKYKERGFDDRNACVYGMVENIDDNVGRLLQELDRLGLTDNTIVLFLTDNGPNTRDRYNGGMRGAKASVHEGGVRVPLFIRWPGHIKPGSEVREITSNIDILPHLVDMCSLPQPKTLPLDGMSLVPLIEGKTKGWPDRLLFTHHTRRGEVERSPASVRSQTHRLIVNEKGYQLYNLNDDPGEETNLAENERETVQQMAQEYDQWFNEVTKNLKGRMPIPVGYSGWSEVTLPAHEAYLEGGARYQGRAGWANDWVTNWTTKEDSIAWEIDVENPGTLAASILYTCPKKDVGSTLVVEAGQSSARAKLQNPHDPPHIPSPDRVDRGEVYEKEWGVLPLGPIDLVKGRQKIKLKAIEISGDQAADVKALVLKREN
ncbi:MAG: arylsulfatase [Candidatus Omnitrophica bacterium]|nr:arylsulfatase [Candidatus Omnitrophota bacterium]